MNELHALLIGIDAYLPNDIAGMGYYPNLQGCVRDVERVEAFLRSRLPIPLGSLEKLTASVAGDGSSEPAEPKELWPTYDNMVAAFERLTQRARPGDPVYIHYSGHGNQARTHFPMIKGVAGWDEVLVPTDIGNSGGRYFRDLDLACLLQKMADKGLFVTLVLDSCHSGGATRSHGPGVEIAPGRRAYPRGVLKPDVSERPESRIASRKELLAAWRKQFPEPGIEVRRDFQASTGWLPTPQGYVLIAACTPRQSAFESAFDGDESSGALTHFLLGALAASSPATTYETLFNRVRARVETEFRLQTPMLVGERGRPLFSGGFWSGPGLSRQSDRPAQSHGAVVLAVEDSDLLRLNTGEALGVLEGARFAVHPPDFDPARPGEPQATVVIVQQGATTSLAKIESGAPPDEILPGSRAELLDPGPNLRKTSVALSPEIAPLSSDLSASVYLRVAGEGEDPDFRVAVNALGQIEIQDASGVALPHLRPALPAADPKSAKTAVERLVHLARFANVERLENPEAPERAGQVVAELVGVVNAYDPKQRPDPPEVAGQPSLTLQENQWTFLRITNRSAEDLNIVVLDLQPDWGITQIYPGEVEENFVPLEAGGSFVLPLEAQLPYGIDSGLDVLKVFATRGPADFRWLELPALDHPPRGPAQRTMARSRDGGSSSLEWTTARVEVRISRAPSWRTSPSPGRFASRSV